MPLIPSCTGKRALLLKCTGKVALLKKCCKHCRGDTVHQPSVTVSNTGGTGFCGADGVYTFVSTTAGVYGPQNCTWQWRRADGATIQIVVESCVPHIALVVPGGAFYLGPGGVMGTVAIDPSTGLWGGTFTGLMASGCGPGATLVFG